MSDEVETVPLPQGALVGLAPQSKLQPTWLGYQASPNWTMKHYKSVEFYLIFKMSSPPAQT